MDGFMPPAPLRKRSIAVMLPSVCPVVRRSAIDGAALSFDPGAAGDPANVDPVSGRVVGRPDAGRLDPGRSWLVDSRLPGSACGCGLVLGGRDAEPSLVDGHSSIMPCTLPSSIESSWALEQSWDSFSSSFAPPGSRPRFASVSASGMVVRTPLNAVRPGARVPLPARSLLAEWLSVELPACTV